MDFEITSEIVDTLGVLSESGTWKKEVNIVQWGDSIAKMIYAHGIKTTQERTRGYLCLYKKLKS